MISDARDILLDQNPGTLPNMSSALLNWFQKLTFIKIQKTVVDFDTVEAEQEYYAQGVKYVMKPQDVQTKPEGQRMWIWSTILALPDLVLEPDEIIQFGTIRYRVKDKYDWKEYGFIQYDIIQDYQRSTP